MRVQRRKKNIMTLLEIMIVIFLIGLIGSVIGVNVKGSLEEGKAFKTKQGMEQIKEILLLEIDKGAKLANVISKPEYYLKRSGFCKDPAKLLKDGWGVSYTISEDTSENAESIIKIESESLKQYNIKKNKGKPTSTVEEDSYEDDFETEGVITGSSSSAS